MINEPPNAWDTLFYNGCVLTVNPAFDVIEDGIICVKDGIIERVEKRSGNAQEYPAAERVDAGGGMILPGLVNSHTHLPMSLFRGLADDLPLSEWLNEHIFPAEANHIDPSSVRAGTLLSCLEMLLSGTTTCVDGYFYEDHVAQAVLEIGMRAVLAQGVIDFPAPGAPDPGKNIEAAKSYVERWKGASPLMTPSVFCHSPYTCSEKTLRAAKDAARSANVPFQIHVAETRQEKEAIESEQGCSPAAYLDRLGILDERTLIAHAVWMGQDDIRILENRGAGIAHCPESNMKLASGIAPVPALVAAGIAVGLGTDGCASNNDLDLFSEMDAAAKLHKVTSGDPTVLGAREILRMATIEGARAAGLDHAVGSIEPGKDADLVVVDTRTPRLTPLYHPESHLVYAAARADVRDVYVRGRCLVRGGAPTGMDPEALLADARRVARRIRGGQRP
jgi:5-methylthioadenosine/S-adenosylhomocysteine deaminase